MYGHYQEGREYGKVGFINNKDGYDFMLDTLIDILLFRLHKKHRDGKTPRITTGTVVLGGLIRLSILIITMWWISDVWEFHQFWPLFSIMVVMIVFYPAYREMAIFSQSIDTISESTMCGSCMHFESSAQICSRYDEHITEEYIPCEGMDWEPHSYERP